MKHDFKFAASCLDKTGVDWRGADRGDIYGACALPLAVYLASVYHALEKKSGEAIEEPLWLDDNQDALFRVAVQEKFCGMNSVVKPGRKLVRRARFRSSRTDPMLQLVDMVVGTVGDLLVRKKFEMFEIIKERCVELCPIK